MENYLCKKINLRSFKTEQDVKKVNRKDTRMASMTLIWYFY